MIMGNTYDYTQADFLNDFTIAASYGIDAMALNVGSDYWQLQKTAFAYDAAAQLFTESGVCFKVFVSLDMSSFSTITSGDVLQPFVYNFKSHAAQYFYNDRHFVSTYSGYNPGFSWVTTFLDPLMEKYGIDVYFLPAYSVDTDVNHAYATVESDGQFLWNAWPNDAATGKPVAGMITEDLAQDYIDAKGDKTFMLNISPWFFTHFDNSVKNFNFHSEGLWQQRWEQTVNDLRTGTDFVQITSWNDFGESHYIGPIGPAEPDVDYPEDIYGFDSKSWVMSNGQYVDHSAFADQAVAWIQAYKTGVFPAVEAYPSQVVSQGGLDAYKSPNSDRMYVSYRLQYKDAQTLEALDRVPDGASFAQDAITIDTYLSGAGTIYVYWPYVSDGQVTQQPSQDPFAVPAGNVQTFAPFTDPATGERRYGTPSISLATQGGTYALQMDALWAVMTPTQALANNITFNAYTKKFTGYSVIGG